jgi:hypothetical protein
VLVLAETSPSWPALVLGSSALGAIAGGYITTWIRGRQERDEAMRTRLIEVADEFVATMTDATTAYSTGPLHDAILGRRPLRDDDGNVTELISNDIESTRDLSRKANSVLTVELALAADRLRSEESAMDLEPFLDRARSQLSSKRALVGAADEMVRRARGLLVVGLPATDFDNENDASVATWARSLRTGAESSVWDFVRLSTQRIHEPHPGARRADAERRLSVLSPRKVRSP